MLCEKCFNNITKEQLIKKLIEKTLNNELVWEEFDYISNQKSFDLEGHAYPLKVNAYRVNFNNYLYEINKFAFAPNFITTYMYPCLTIKLKDEVVMFVPDKIAEKLILAIESKTKMESKIFEEILLSLNEENKHR